MLGNISQLETVAGDLESFHCGPLFLHFKEIVVKEFYSYNFLKGHLNSFDQHMFSLSVLSKGISGKEPPNSKESDDILSIFALCYFDNQSSWFLKTAY